MKKEIVLGEMPLLIIAKDQEGRLVCHPNVDPVNDIHTFYASNEFREALIEELKIGGFHELLELLISCKNLDEE
jgi:hypothetical protein